MKKVLSSYFLCTAGAVLFVLGINMIIAPLGLYNGGFVGIGQLVRYVLATFFRIDPQGIDLAGIVYFLLNVPLFVLAFRSMSKDFLIKTVYTVVLQTILLSLVPIPAKTFTEDMLTACVIGGLVAGTGVGMILRAGSSGGGQDILGVYFAKRGPVMTVGKISFLINTLVYGCCALLFDLEIVVYSLIYTAVMSVVIDKVHLQSVTSMALIVTKEPAVAEYLMGELRRGVTIWDGMGAYSRTPVKIMLTALSKYEAAALKRKVTQLDEHAFVLIQNEIDVCGNFVRHMEA